MAGPKLPAKVVRAVGGVAGAALLGAVRPAPLAALAAVGAAVVALRRGRKVRT